MPLHDVRIAIRLLLKSPGFTAAAVLMLALGIGATTAVFSVVEGVLLRPLPFPHSEDLVQLSDVVQGAEEAGGKGEVGVTAPDIQAYTRDTQSFESLGGYQQTNYELSGMGEPAQVNASRLTGGVFPALEVAPLLGRFFTQQEDDQKEPVAVLSYSLWQNRLQGDRRVLGTKILLDRKPYVVIGVMPRNFEFPLVPGHLNRSELWIPMSFTQQELTTGAEAWNSRMVGRLRTGITPAQAESDAERVAQERMRNYPAFMASMHIHAVVRSLQKETVEQAGQLVRTLFLAVIVVLLIACAVGVKLVIFGFTIGSTGTLVTIKGSGLIQATTVKFGTVKASTFTVVSDAEVKADVPSGLTPGAVTISITTPGGTANSPTKFTVH
jgi:MacB-like protein/IPT/TIG domain-containing protein